MTRWARAAPPAARARQSRPRRPRQQRTPGSERTAPEDHLAFRYFPAAAADDMHGLILRIRCLPRIRRPAITGKSRLWQGQVMRQQ